MKFKFNCNISGSINGYDVKDFEKGQIVDKKDLSEFLLSAWLKSNVIEEVKEEEKDEETEGQEENQEENAEKEENSESDETEKDGTENVADNTSNTGDEDVDKFLNGETDKLPEGTQIISEEEAKKLLENSEGKSEENQEENAEKEENGENADEKLLIDEAKKLLASEDTSIDTDRLKEIGIALHIQNMSKTVNAETIVNKIKKYIEDYEEKEQTEADADNVQEQ